MMYQEYNLVSWLGIDETVYNVEMIIIYLLKDIAYYGAVTGPSKSLIGTDLCNSHFFRQAVNIKAGPS